MTSNFNYGFADNMSPREMLVEKEVSQWSEVFYQDVGRVTGLSTATIKDVFLEKCIFSQERKVRYREFSRGSAVFFVNCVGGNYILEMCQPRSGSAVSSTYYEVGLYGSTPNVESKAAMLAEALEKNIRGRHEEVTWIFADGGHIDEVVFPLKKYKPIMPEVYPFIKPDVDTWIDRFIASDSNVLILNGPMGTGKSSLIAHIINRGKFSALTAFDEKVMKNDNLYTNFISWQQNLMVLEDADLLLLGRTDKDNDTMSKLLNVSEGIIDTHGKKIIFTANLGNTKDIDAALLRPGRCFDIVEFRELTMAEANGARTKLGKRLFNNEKRTYSLAQVYQTE
jgi:hypothetical protein